jgi:hypothetical protein
VQRILEGLALIEGIAITAVAGDRVSYRIDVRGGAGRLSRALRFTDLVEQDLIADPGELEDAALEFYYNP